MKTVLGLFAAVCTVSSVAAQPPVGALAIDERGGDQYGWAVDYETAAAARALSECGAGCAVVLTFGRCVAYAADQGRGQHGRGLGGIVRVVGRCAPGGAGGVQLAGRLELHRPGVGLQRPRVGGGAGSGPSGST